MKFLRIVLTGLYCIFAVAGIASIATGRASPFAIIFVIVYLTVAAALNLKGGNVARWVAYGFSVLFMAFGFLSLVMIASSFFGQEFDRLLPYVFAVFGIVGFTTFISLKRLPSVGEIGASGETTIAMILQQLENTLARKDSDAIEENLTELFKAGLSIEAGPTLVKILSEDWHSEHEDIVRWLQKIKYPLACETLFSAATKQFSYLDYDECFGLARKCTWALADIGTSEAKAFLLILAEDSNPYIARYAKKRIDNWDNELARKGI